MKQPPGPKSKTATTEKTTAETSALIHQVKFAKGDTEPTKNYTILDPQTTGVTTAKPAILIGNNGKLYLRSDLMPKDGSGVTLTITVS